MYNYKVSYGKYLTEKNSYNQMINVTCTREKLESVNKTVRENIERISKKTVKTEAELNYVLYCKELHERYNFTNCTTLRLFLTEFGFLPRVKLDRNTVIFIKVKD